MLRLTKSITGTTSLESGTTLLFIRQDETYDDALVNLLINESRNVLENYLGISLIVTNITGITDSTDFEIPYGPLIQLYSVKTLSGQTNLNYLLLDERIVILDKFYDDLVEFKYKAGKDTLESGLMLAWKQVFSFLYENRGDVKLDDFLSNNQVIRLYKKKFW